MVTGLAWTETGGDILYIEATTMRGKGHADADRASGRRDEGVGPCGAHLRALPGGEARHQPRVFGKTDVHIHVPAGAIPKDGPSAGVTMATALASVFTNTPVRKDVAMTGEVTLRGRVLPIGGLKEKTLAATRAGIKTVIIPKENEKDLEDIPKYLRKDMKFIFATTVDDVLAAALGKKSRKKRATKPAGNKKTSRNKIGEGDAALTVKYALTAAVFAMKCRPMRETADSLPRMKISCLGEFGLINEIHSLTARSSASGSSRHRRRCGSHETIGFVRSAGDDGCIDRTCAFRPLLHGFYFSWMEIRSCKLERYRRDGGHSEVLPLFTRHPDGCFRGSGEKLLPRVFFAVTEAEHNACRGRYEFIKKRSCRERDRSG